MKVFVTGATGFIGSAIVRELIASGHQVLGLARSDAAAEKVAAAGAEAHRGALDDLDSLRSGVAASGGVVHATSGIDFTDLARTAEMGRRAVETLGAALAGSDRPLVVTSAIALLSPARLATEDDEPSPDSPAAFGAASEAAVLAMASDGVRVSVVRLPLSVHGDGDHGFVPSLINIARASGTSAYTGDGSNRWPAVHRLDAAHLFRLALETAPAGSRLHAVGDEGVPFRDIAGVIGRNLNLPVVSISRPEAGAHFGFLTAFASLDNPASSALTQERFGWRPAHSGLIADLEQGHYFHG